MAISPKSRRPWGQYTSAEDLCDLFDGPADAAHKPSSGTSAAEGYGSLARSTHSYDDTDASDTSDAPTRPRRHAINLAEALSFDDRKSASRGALSHVPTVANGRTVPSSSPRTVTAPKTSARPYTGFDAESDRRDEPRRAVALEAGIEPDTPFAIRSVHPSGEGETVTVELCVPAAFAEAVTAADGRQNGLYAQKSKNSERLRYGDTTVEPRSPTRSKCDFSADLGEYSPADPTAFSLRDSTVLSDTDAPDGRSAPAANTSGTAVRLKLYLLIEQYAELRPCAGAITEEEADTLVAAGKLCAAVRRGMRLLGYGDRSARRLAYQLTAKGVDRDTAEAAAEYLCEKGLIQEDNSARLRAESNLRKLWGPRRIREDLRANGYPSAAIDDAMDVLADTDFEANCAALIRRKYRSELADGSLASDRTARQKLIASLMRLGYDTDTIRSALRLVLENTENH